MPGVGRSEDRMPSNAMPDARFGKEDIPVNAFKPQLKNLASIIRGFKSSVTIHARDNNIAFAWQARFHDHIIRDEESYQKIKNYIRTNPQNWDQDMFRK